MKWDELTIFSVPDIEGSQELLKEYLMNNERLTEDDKIIISTLLTTSSIEIEDMMAYGAVWNLKHGEEVPEITEEMTEEEVDAFLVDLMARQTTQLRDRRATFLDELVKGDDKV